MVTTSGCQLTFPQSCNQSVDGPCSARPRIVIDQKFTPPSPYDLYQLTMEAPISHVDSIRCMDHIDRHVARDLTDRERFSRKTLHKHSTRQGQHCPSLLLQRTHSIFPVHSDGEFGVACCKARMVPGPSPYPKRLPLQDHHDTYDTGRQAYGGYKLRACRKCHFEQGSHHSLFCHLCRQLHTIRGSCWGLVLSARTGIFSGCCTSHSPATQNRRSWPTWE